MPRFFSGISSFISEILLVSLGFPSLSGGFSAIFPVSPQYSREFLRNVMIEDGKSSGCCTFRDTHCVSTFQEGSAVCEPTHSASAHAYSLLTRRCSGNG